MSDEPQSGCTNGFCWLRAEPLVGQHTNGPCNCLRDIPLQLQLAIKRKLTRQRDEILSLTEIQVRDSERIERLAGEVARLTAENELLKSQIVKEMAERAVFINDPFRTLCDAFATMYLNTPMPTIQWSDEFSLNDHKAETIFPDDESDGVLINIHPGNTVADTVELLAHELAHVGCEARGLENPVTPEEHDGEKGRFWREIFGEIHKRYSMLTSEVSDE